MTLPPVDKRFNKISTPSLAIPKIETERLILRGPKESDLDALAEFHQDEEASQYVGGIRPRYTVWRSIAADLGHWAIRGFGFFAVDLKDTGDFIGWCGPWSPEGWPGHEIGWGIFPKYQRNGYAIEAAIASMKFAYGELGWKTAISCIDPKNTGSIGVATKLGATKEQSDVEVCDFRADVWRHLPPDQFQERYS